MALWPLFNTKKAKANVRYKEILCTSAEGNPATKDARVRHPQVVPPPA